MKSKSNLRRRHNSKNETSTMSQQLKPIHQKTKKCKISSQSTSHGPNNSHDEEGEQLVT
jgi:hypothetical protein